MKSEGDFLILMDEHFKSLNLDDHQRQAAKDILNDADAIVDNNGEINISIQAYTDYILFRLNELKDSARKLQSLNDLKDYEFIARNSSYEWSIMIGNIAHLVARGKGIKEIDDIEHTFEALIDDVRLIFEHMIEADRLFFKFGRLLEIGSANSN